MKIFSRKPTRGLIAICAIFVLVLVSTFTHSDRHPSEPGDVTANAQENYTKATQNLLSNQPLRFVANQGQAGVEAKFHVEGAGHTVLFCENKVLLRRSESEYERHELELQFPGANEAPFIEGVEELPGVAHFYKGNDPDQWRTNVPTYSSVLYKELYPGIDMAYIGNNGTLESEFYVSPGTDYHQIKLDYRGIDSKKISDDGSLVIKTELGDLVEKTPYVYQDIGGSREEIEAEYVLLDDATIGFELGHYDNKFPVVIDPELVFITAIPAPGGNEWTSGVTADSDGNMVLVGVASRNFPVTDTIQGSNHYDGLASGLLLKLDGTTGEVMYSALFGGTKVDYFNAVTIDTSDNIFIAGQTSSEDFPTMNAIQDTIGGSIDAFLTILNASGELTYSTYLGGNAWDVANEIALDQNGSIYIGGDTKSLDFPSVNGFQTEISGEADGSNEYPSDGFVTKFTPAGAIEYSTYLGGAENEYVSGMAVDALGQVTITGTTKSEDFPLANAYQGTIAGGSSPSDIFITRLNSSGDALMYSTYFGGNDWDYPSGIALDSSGHTLISGETWSEDFPIIDGESFPEANTTDGVLIMLDNSGQPVYALRSNIPGDDFFSGVVVDDRNQALPVGGVNLESIVIYELSESGSVRSDFTFEELVFIDALHYSITYILWRHGFILFSLNHYALPSIPEAAAAKVRIKDLYTINCDEGMLSVNFNGPNDDTLAIGSDNEGNVTINGTPIDKKAEDVTEIIVCGSDGEDDIDLRGVTKEEFPNVSASSEVPKIFIKGGGGVDEIYTAKNIDTEVQGGAGTDLIFGGSGNDILSGDEGDDLIDGGDGKDTINGDEGDDGISGGGGNDNINGDEGEDYINSGDGNDVVDGGGDGDNIEGGDGNDQINGGDGDDIIQGGDGDDLILGGDGDDYVEGDEGDDIIAGGEGDDDIYGGPGGDGISGGIGEDFLVGEEGEDFILGGDDADEIFGGADDDEIEGGSGNDLIYGEGGSDNLIGGEGNDEIAGGSGGDLILGGDGHDVIDGEDGDDIIGGGAGSDQIYGGPGDDGITGGRGNDILIGGAGTDFITGNEGFNYIETGTGDTEAQGGPDNDFIDIIDDLAFSPAMFSYDMDYPVVLHVTDVQAPLIIRDSSGIDTLSFNSYNMNIVVDIDLLGSAQIIDTSGSLVELHGVFESVVGSVYDDTISVSPLSDTVRFIDGNDGNDVLNFNVEGAEPVDDGYTISTPGYADVRYINIEKVNLPVVTASIEPVTDIHTINNYPNPFVSSTTIQYLLPETSLVKLNIYNSSGQIVATLTDERQPPGEHLVLWNGDSLKGEKMTAGVYFYVFETDGFRSSGKMILIR